MTRRKGDKPEQPTVLWGWDDTGNPIVRILDITLNHNPREDTMSHIENILTAARLNARNLRRWRTMTAVALATYSNLGNKAEA